MSHKRRRVSALANARDMISGFYVRQNRICPAVRQVRESNRVRAAWALRFVRQHLDQFGHDLELLRVRAGQEDRSKSILTGLRVTLTCRHESLCSTFTLS